MERNRQNNPVTQGLRTQDERGFSILESAIAMVIMTVAVLASASLFAYSVKNNSGANDRELAMAVAQQQMEQLRNAIFTDATLNETVAGGESSTITRAGRQYTVLKTIVNSNTVDGLPTMKTITIQVTPKSSTLGAVVLRTKRSTTLRGPY